MANRKDKQGKKENALVRYFRDTRSELKKVRWPNRKEAWSLTRIVLLVTVGMAIFLGAMDFFFGWILRGIISQDVLFFVIGIVVVAALAAASVLIGQGEEV